MSGQIRSEANSAIGQTRYEGHLMCRTVFIFVEIFIQTTRHVRILKSNKNALEIFVVENEFRIIMT